MNGELDVLLDGERLHLVSEVFVWVVCATRRELRTMSDMRVMTIWCAKN